MAAVIDLTKGETTVFYGSSAEDVNYAKNFWQSIQLHPPMESRLVSSDIKQRLKVAPPSSQARNVLQSRQEDSSAVLQDFISRAKTMEHLEEYAKLQRMAEAKAEEKTLLLKHREIRKKKEEISKNKGIKPVEKKEEKMPKEDYIVDDENETDVLKQLDDFEADKIGSNDSDSD